MDKKGCAVNAQYFTQVVEEEKDLLYRLAYNIMQNTADSEDAVAEAICKAWESRKKLRKPENFRSWLIRITINTAKNMTIKRNHMRPVDDIEPYCQNQQEVSGDIWYCLEQLKQKERIVVILYYYKGFSVKEIAGILRIPEGTVKSRLSKARENLRKLI